MALQDPGSFDETQVLARTKIGLVVMITGVLGVAPAVAVMASRGASGVDWVVIALVLAFVLALPWSIRTRVRVGEDGLRVRFWFLPTARIDPAAIEGLEVVTFSPLGDFGGWGYKLTRKHGRVYCIAGETGVRFRVGKRRYVVASMDAPALALALVEAGAPAPETLEAVSVRERPLYDEG